ncbi:uncharacterized protein involved in exopolysaccharide biosynthesis [Pedobacter sp. UYP30]|uniref:GumC family protein n=1 Tax=Pedobacter sp. UYP30 TaxID=1756400 RepID=UPI00339271EB
MTNKNETDKQGAKPTLKKTFNRFWAAFLFLLILAVFCAWLYIRITPKIYKASAEVFNSPNGEKAKAIQNIADASKTITSEVALYQAVEQLGLYAEVFSKSNFKKSSLYKNAPIEIKTETISTLKATENIPFNFNDYLVEINGKGYPYNKWVKTPYGELMFSRNMLVSRIKSEHYYFSLFPAKEAISALSKKIIVIPSANDTNHLNISLTDENPIRAIAILNTIIKNYTERSIEAHNLLAVNTAKFINNQLELVEAELLTIEQKLKAHQAKEKGAFGELSKRYLEKVIQVDEKMGERSINLIIITQLQNYVESPENKGGINPSNAGIDDLNLTQTVKALYKKRASLQQAKTVAQSENKSSISTNSEVLQLKSQLKDRLQTLKDKFKKDIGMLSNRANSYSSMLNSLSETEKNVVYIQRQQQIKSNIYTFLLQQKEKTSISYITDGADRKITKQASALLAPISPNRPKIFLVAILIAIMGCIAYTKFKEIQGSRFFVSERDNDKKTK